TNLLTGAVSTGLTTPGECRCGGTTRGRTLGARPGTGRGACCPGAASPGGGRSALKTGALSGRTQRAPTKIPAPKTTTSVAGAHHVCGRAHQVVVLTTSTASLRHIRSTRSGGAGSRRAH